MKRLALLSTYFPIREFPGRGQSAYHTLLHLRSRFEIAVFCPHLDYPKWLEPQKHNYVRPDFSYQPEGIRTHYFNAPALPLLTRPINGYLIASKARPLIEAFRPDILLNYTVFPDGHAAVLTGRCLGVPVVLGAIGSDINRMPDPITRRFTLHTLHQADYLITVSEHLRRTALSLGVPPERCRAVHNGCDGEQFQPSERATARQALGIPEDAYLVVFTGWIAETKGVPELLEAFSRLAPQHPRLHLACLGRGHLVEPALVRFRAEGLDGRIHFPGFVTAPQLAQWLAACDISTLPSHMEGCPNVVLEALHAGRPVLATNVGGIPEIVRHPEQGVLIPPRSPAHIAEAIESMMKQEWDARAIRRVSQRTWTDAAADTAEILEEVLRRGPRR
jgi:teichuronic acid biosynthesis glycosyltransferase TuaC